MKRLEGDCVIAGSGETELGRFPDRTSVDLQAEAVLAAVADAGLSPRDIDGLFSLAPYSDPQMIFGATLCEYLGIRPQHVAAIDAGGMVSAMHMIANAIWSVESGLCDVVVCVQGEARYSGRIREGAGLTSTAQPIEFEAPFGIVGSVAPYALLAARHMHEYGTTPEGLGAVAISARAHASRRPNSARRTPISMDDYLESELVASPLRVLDCGAVIDGAGALVLTRAERMQDLPRPAVRVLSYASQASHRNVGQFRDFAELGIRSVADRALGAAELKLSDIDVAQFHDAFTISTIVYLEELGFCDRGQGGDYALAGGLDLGSSCPVNTHGGHLSQGHLGGFLLVTEAVRQLRGDAEAGQVHGAQTALLAGGGGVLGINAVMTLRRD